MQIHFRVHASAGLPDLDFRELEAEVVALTRTWDDELRDRLVERHGEAQGRALVAQWAPRFPRYYKASRSPQLAMHDIGCFVRLETLGEPFVVGLQNETDQSGERTRVGLYKAGGKVELAEAMPMLEDLGLRVIEEVPTRLKGGDGETWVQDFGVLGAGDRPLDLEAYGARVADCISAVWRGDTESDSLNRLVLAAGLDWRQIEILRAYRKYRQRIGSRFTESYQNDVLVRNATVTEKLVHLFELRFDPEHARDEAAEAALREEIIAGLDEVESLDDDRILRNQLGLIEATLRTNAYRRGRGAMAFKLRSADVPAIPQPVPLMEIYVYSAAMEGIHLRGGRIARGGIRWSDRQDYRTEVLGLMRAQLTKNAQIVPEGAKGGFYLKQRPSDPGELRDEVKRQYVAYVRALLDVTDNLVDGEVVHPPDVRVLDEDDTYLVVAADKGTATFSDTANGVAEEYGYWLGDAFASGGSSGYDHKKLGITARGAWESVKRHLRELEIDPDSDPFTVVGIGDMSGDVFGNGMLLSDRIRLVGAYDHRHIFIDPDPDPDAGFAERTRLFDLAGSSWNDYDRAKISEGGGVWPRTAKRIPLSEATQSALGIEDESLAPNDLIRAILRAPVDLLWNGGIGTIVKASDETDEAAQDRSSDAIRVDASELRARAVGEGGNLGLTRRARVEFARKGGRINADFIDNSAGVDCSDHEVNLKILLGLAERRGELTRPDRDALLSDMTEDVVAHVLYDSFLQAQIIAQETERSAGRLDAYEDLMVVLEEDGLLDRASEALPSGEELADRRRAGRGMERPELASLLTFAKRRVKRSLLDSPLLDDPWLERDLRDYFPHAVVERFAPLLGEHPLRRELIATVNANLVVNALGSVFVSQLVAERGAAPAEVVRAVPHRARGDRRRGRLGGDRDPRRQHRPGGPGRADGRRRRSRRRGHALVPLRGPDPRPRRDDRGRARRVREAGGGGAAARRRGTPPGAQAIAERLVAAGVPEGLADAHALRPALVHAPSVVAVARRHRAPRRGRGAGLLHRRRPAPARRPRGRARHRPGRRPDAALGARRPCARTAAASAARSPSTRSWRHRAPGRRRRSRTSSPRISRTAGGWRRSCGRSRGSRRRIWRGSRWRCGSCGR